MGEVHTFTIRDIAEVDSGAGAAGTTIEASNADAAMATFLEQRGVTHRILDLWVARSNSNKETN